MKLFDYLKKCEDGTEVTVSDKIYDTETYFYLEQKLQKISGRIVLLSCQNW
jgi:hypothetical protein